MEPPNILENVLFFYRRLQDDEHHRYRSWEHCYAHFQGRSSVKNERDIDLAALHLSFYLASWGMYRGSSFLLWKDYKLHGYVVRRLLAPQYDGLWALEPASLCQGSTELDLVVQLGDEVRDAYGTHVTQVNGVVKQPQVTDTLVTKVLLGTMACVPASDQFVIEGLRHVDLPYSRLNQRYLVRLAGFYRDNREAFEEARSAVSGTGITYPPMKVMDMYFWSIGVRLARDDEGLFAD